MRMLSRLLIITASSLCMISCSNFSLFAPTKDDGIYDPACNGGKRLNPWPKPWYGMKREEVRALDGTPVRSFESKSDNSGKKILVEEYKNPTKDWAENVDEKSRDVFGNRTKYLTEYCNSYYYTYDPETDTLVGVSIMGQKYRIWSRYRDSTEWYCNQCSKSKMIVY